MVIGRARRCRSGKWTWRLSHCAWKPAKRAVMVWKRSDLRPLQFLFDEAVAVEIVGGLEREKRGHPHHHRAQGFVAKVEVVVGEAAALAGEDPVIRILGGIFGDADAKARPLLHALEDEVDAVGVVPSHAALPGQDMVFLAHALLSPFDRQAMIA